MALTDGGGRQGGDDGSYAVGSVPGAGLAVLGAVRVGGQAAAGVWVVGGHVRGPLCRVIVLGKGWAGGHAVTLPERTEWQQCHCLLTVNKARLIPKKSCDMTRLHLSSRAAHLLCVSSQCSVALSLRTAV